MQEISVDFNYSHAISVLHVNLYIFELNFN